MPERLVLRAGLLVLGGVVVRQLLAWLGDSRQARALREAPEAAPPALTATPRVSILVAAWNEREMIDRHLESVLGLRYPNLEYVLCAGGPDGTYERARRRERDGLIVLEQRPGEGKQRALRRCLERSSGEILFLTDADCLLDDLVFERTLAPLVDEGEAAATGTARPLPEQLASSDFVRAQWAVWFYRGPSVPRYIAGMLGRNAAVRREVLVRAGGFDVDARSGTDLLLANLLQRSGDRVRYVRDSWMVTAYADDYAGYVRQQARWLWNFVEHGARFRDPASALHGGRTMLTAAAVVGATVSAPFLGAAGWLAWACLIAHATLARARYLAFARQATGSAWPIPWLKLPIYFYLDVAAWTWALFQVGSGRARVAW